MKIKNRLDKIKEELRQLAANIRNLPDNSNAAKTLNRNCAIIRASECARHNRLDARYHIFGWQYDLLADFLENLPAERAISKIEQILKTGKTEQWKFHPEVIKNVKKLVDGRI